jgi:DNA-binding HxlR family transcriptional regulator
MDAVVRRSPVRPSDCNLAKSFSLVGDRWSLLILRGALYGVRRFEDFQAELNIPRTILSVRLTKLVENGLMEKRQYKEPGGRARHEYVLTEMGQDMRLSFIAMTEWADRWIGRSKVRPVYFTKHTTGDVLRVALVDKKGREVKFDNADRKINPKLKMA